MKTLYTFGLILFTSALFAQVPTNFGSNAEDGITYQTYNLIDHGAVSSVRFMAQNAVTEGDANWEFYTGNYMDNWRPYAADDTLSSFDIMIDPASETASARYNSNFGGATGKLPAVQAGFYYTAIIGNNAVADNFMSIIETDFDPVVIDTVYNTPLEPTETDNITVTVELDGSLALSPGERVFIRASTDGWASSLFVEVTNISNGVGSIFLPAGTIPGGITVDYYALVTEEENPVHETIDFYTLFFGHNNGANYSFTVSTVTGVEDAITEYGIIQTQGLITVSKAESFTHVELVALDGKTVAFQPVQSSMVNLSTSGLPTGMYILNMISPRVNASAKLFVH